MDETVNVESHVERSNSNIEMLSENHLESFMTNQNYYTTACDHVKNCSLAFDFVHSDQIISSSNTSEGNASDNLILDLEFDHYYGQDDVGFVHAEYNIS